jgi:hypothetical protein
MTTKLRHKADYGIRTKMNETVGLVTGQPNEITPIVQAPT